MIDGVVEAPLGIVTMNMVKLTGTLLLFSLGGWLPLLNVVYIKVNRSAIIERKFGFGHWSTGHLTFY